MYTGVLRVCMSGLDKNQAPFEGWEKFCMWGMPLCIHTGGGLGKDQALFGGGKDFAIHVCSGAAARN